MGSEFHLEGKGKKIIFPKSRSYHIKIYLIYLESVYKLPCSMRNVIPAKAGIQSFQDLLDAGSSPA